MGASSSSASAAATTATSPIPTDTQFRRGKLACRFLMISNCALAVYIITRPRNREPNKAKRPPPSPSAAAAPDEARDATQRQMLLREDPPPATAFGDPAGAVARIEEH